MRHFLDRLFELPQLIFLNLIVSWRSLFEYFRVIWRYYGNQKFRRADLALLRSYFWSNPYRIHKRFLQKRGEENPYQYGETWITSMALIAKKAEITAKDIYVELGCGRGRTCFWVNAFIGCPVCGIDYVPDFIERAQAVVEKQKLTNIKFFCADFFDGGWEKGSVFYLDGTLLEGEEIAQLIRHCDDLPTGSRFIAVNFSLTGDFPGETSHWIEEARWTVDYPWGDAEVALFRAR